MKKTKKLDNINKININEIKNPEFLKSLNYKELEAFSRDVRNYILEKVSINGGHLSSNLGVVESTIALCRSFDFSKDKIVFDVGHQCYTYKILTGRKLDNLRKRDGVSGYQKMSESPYDHFEAGHSSTSISVANGMAIARDIKNENYNVIAFIGDASIANGLAFEGLNQATQGNHKIIIVLNDNDMSISKPVGGLARSFRKFSTSTFYRGAKNFFQRLFRKVPKIYKAASRFKNWVKRHVINMTLFDKIGYSVIGPIDGHDFKALDRAFAKAKKINNSVVVHIKTLKGLGYKLAEKDNIGEWHGVGKFDIETGEILKGKENQTWSEIYENILFEKMGENKNMVTVVPATGTGSALQPIFKKYPNRIIDVGISEEHAVTMSSSLAKQGIRPVISIYSTFLQRAFDEIIHDADRLNCGITFLIDRCGFVGPDGDTHQGIYDESFLYDIPHTIIAMASNKSYANQLFNESLKHNHPFFIRYPREYYLDNYENDVEISFGKWVVENHCDNDKTVIITFGPLINKLKDMISKEEINACLINAIYQKPMDVELIKKISLTAEKVIIYNPYATENGFVKNLLVEFYKNRYSGKIKTISIPNEYISHDTIDGQRKAYNVSIDDVVKELE